MAATETSAKPDEPLSGLEAENARLREELARLRSTVDSLPLGLYQVTPDGELITLNPAAQAILDRGDVQAPLADLVPDAISCRRPPEREPLSPEDDVHDREAVWTGKDGKTYHIRESVRVVRDGAGRPTYYQCTLEDITERRQAEAALRSSEELYRLVVEHSPAGILLVDDERRIVYANVELGRILGRPVSQAIGMPFTEFLDEESVDIVTERYAMRQAGEHVPPRYQAWALHSDGSRRLVSINASVFRTSGNAIRTVAQVLDITDRTRAEQALRDYTEALEVRNAELDAFADTVAHDLKNPLSTIIGFAEALLEAMDDLPPEDVRRVLQRISTMGRKMDSIIQELLLFARIRQEAVEPEPINMRIVVENALDRLEGARERVGGEIKVPSHWPVALGYGPWVEEVWANYISNALKYGGRPPVVTLGSNLTEGGQIRFWVRDNGDGIEAERQAFLFEGGSSPSAALKKGHGLGLSIVKRIVTKLGGQVDVESTAKPGEGSTFSFTLPAATLASRP